jgi:hypothetical protein
VTPSSSSVAAKRVHGAVAATATASSQVSTSRSGQQRARELRRVHPDHQQRLADVAYGVRQPLAEPCAVLRDQLPAVGQPRPRRAVEHQHAAGRPRRPRDRLQRIGERRLRERRGLLEVQRRAQPRLAPSRDGSPGDGDDGGGHAPRK